MIYKWGIVHCYVWLPIARAYTYVVILLFGYDVLKTLRWQSLGVSHDSDFDPDQMETIRIMKQAINHYLVGGLICLIPVNPSNFRLFKKMLDVPILSSGWWFMNGNGTLYPLVIAIENGPFCSFCSLIYLLKMVIFHSKLLVYQRVSGWWFQLLRKKWVRQLGWWNSQYMEK